MENMLQRSQEQEFRDDLHRNLRDICDVCVHSAELSHRQWGRMQVPEYLEPTLKGNHLERALSTLDAALQIAEDAGEQEIFDRFAKYQGWFRKMYACITNRGSLCLRISRQKHRQ